MGYFVTTSICNFLEVLLCLSMFEVQLDSPNFDNI
jgi:hypothetical protein